MKKQKEWCYNINVLETVSSLVKACLQNSALSRADRMSTETAILIFLLVTIC